MGEQQVANLILEHLKRFQGGQDRAERKLDEVIHRLGQLERPLPACAVTSPMPMKTRRCSVCASIA